MRITILNQFYKPDISPTAHLCASLAEHRAQMGDEVTVIASQGGYVSSSTQTAESKSVLIRRVWTPKFGKSNLIKRCIDYAVFYLISFFKILRLPSQEVIITLTTPPYIAYVALAHKLLYPSTKVILWNMDCYPDAAEQAGVIKKNGIISFVLRRLNRIMFERLDFTVGLDSAMLDLLYRQYAPHHSLPEYCIIPNWEKESFFPRNALHAEWEKTEALGLRGKFVILYLGNAGYGHQFDDVITAARELRNDPVVFLFIGGGARYKQLEEAKKSHSLDNLLVLGYVPKESTPSVMSAASCALITMQDSMLGVMSPSKLHSNLAMSLPIIYIGPAGSNVDECVKNYACGLSARSGCSTDIVQFARRMLADASEFRQMKLNARNAFESAYCDSITLPKFDRIIETVLKRS